MFLIIASYCFDTPEAKYMSGVQLDIMIVRPAFNIRPYLSSLWSWSCPRNAWWLTVEEPGLSTRPYLKNMEKWEKRNMQRGVKRGVYRCSAALWAFFVILFFLHYISFKVLCGTPTPRHELINFSWKNEITLQLLFWQQCVYLAPCLFLLIELLAFDAEANCWVLNSNASILQRVATLLNLKLVLFVFQQWFFQPMTILHFLLLQL